ncbi:hypothetical protein ACJU26_01745 [Acidithiobacillus sp. M4-SHS-6]|uniref:hypothetical protein n=1 Tax=Acidithiobacillus sp. M4-SHS-6 TaxID=3383024 RepID=UPI0039BDE151
MLKWVLLAGCAAVLFYFWRQKKRQARRRPALESLVRCSRCGRYVSVHSALRSAEGDYRCIQHAGQQHAGDPD